MNIEARTLSGLTPSEAGDSIYRGGGGVCLVPVICVQECKACFSVTSAWASSAGTKTRRTLQLLRPLLRCPHLTSASRVKLSCLCVLCYSRRSICLWWPPTARWSSWLSRDDPTGTGDRELLSDLKSSYPGQICQSPRYIEAVTVDSLTSAAITGEIYQV